MKLINLLYSLLFIYTYIHGQINSNSLSFLVHECICCVHMQATMRTWKQYYTVLSGPELCFYKDRKDFQQVNICTYLCYYYALTIHINTNKVVVIINCTYV